MLFFFVISNLFSTPTNFRMDTLIESIDKTTGRKVFQYIGFNGEKEGRIVSRKQHLTDLQAQGKLKLFDIDKISFSSKRKRSSNSESLSTCSNSQEPSLCIPGSEVKEDCSFESQTKMPAFLLSENRSLLTSSVSVLPTEFTNTEPTSTTASNMLQDEASLKVRNELSKKVSAIESLKATPEIPGFKDVCKVLDQCRSQPEINAIDEEWKRNMVEVLTNDQSSNDEIYQLLSTSNPIRNFFFEEIIQEALMCGMRQTILKEFPPVLKENICLGLIEELKVFAPNLLSLVLKFCTKPNEPVTEKQGRKVVNVISQLMSCLNQKDSALQKLVALKLKLSGITNSGLDFLSDLGITQSSRSWQKDCDFLASISRDYLIEELKKCSFSFLVDNLDKIIDGNLVNFTSVILIADRKTESDLSDEIPKDKVYRRGSN